MNTQPQTLLDSFIKTPKDGDWYLMGTNVPANWVPDPDLDEEIRTVVRWDKEQYDWQFITFSYGEVSSAGMVGLHKQFED